jgi:hypothetical protein
MRYPGVAERKVFLPQKQKYLPEQVQKIRERIMKSQIIHKT